VVEQRLDAAVGVDQFGGDLLADAGHAGHVIGGIAPERLNVHDLVRADAEFLFHRLAADQRAVHRVHHLDPLADQLHQVLVGRDDRDLDALLPRGGDIAGDDVVGLVAAFLDAGNVEGAHGLARERDLRAQVLRHFRAVGLVLGINLVAEGLARRVEDHRQPVALGGVAQQLHQHVGEAVNREGRRPVRARHRGR
jgi:hypothetical protein